MSTGAESVIDPDLLEAVERLESAKKALEADPKNDRLRVTAHAESRAAVGILEDVSFWERKVNVGIQKRMVDLTGAARDLMQVQPDELSAQVAEYATEAAGMTYESIRQRLQTLK